MRNIIYSTAGLLLFTGILEVLLPEGNMKKYASTLMGIVVTTALISLFTQIGSINLGLEEINYKIDEKAWEEETAEKVLDEYIVQLESIIGEKGGEGVRVKINEEMHITKVTLAKQPSVETIRFLTEEMGLMPNDIEIE